MRAYNDPMTKTYDVAILGGGIVGRTLALLLARERLRVALVERAPPAGGATHMWCTGVAARSSVGHARTDSSKAREAALSA